MTSLGTAIAESVIHHYGRPALLARLSDPFWFQALGSVMGMDWHSSGITTSVMGALKKGLNPKAHELGVYVCGGRGRQSLRTPEELRDISDRVGIDGAALVRTSRLTARIDNNAVDDGFQIYLHSFVVTVDGDWSVVQQGMNEGSQLARRYHWHSAAVRDFTADPHTGIVGVNAGTIRNLVDRRARPAQDALLAIAQDDPARTLATVRRLQMPSHHEVRASDVNDRRLGAGAGARARAGAVVTSPRCCCSSSWARGPCNHSRWWRKWSTARPPDSTTRRGSRSRTAARTVTHSPSRSTCTTRRSMCCEKRSTRPRPGRSDKLDGMARLDAFTRAIERNCSPCADVEAVVARERETSARFGGRTVFDDRPAGRPRPPAPRGQLRLFQK